MIYRGACHCGAVRARYETEGPVRLRHDGCWFCASPGVRSASDASGQLATTSTHPFTRYCFEHKTADYLICPVCGAYVATLMQSPHGLVGVINVVGLQVPQLKNLGVTTVGLDGESSNERVARRLSRWTPMTLAEGAPA